MSPVRIRQVVFALIALSLIGFLVFQIGLITPPWAEDQGEVRVLDSETGNELAVVAVEVADTQAQIVCSRQTCWPGSDNGYFFATGGGIFGI